MYTLLIGVLPFLIAAAAFWIGGKGGAYAERERVVEWLEFQTGSEPARRIHDCIKNSDHWTKKERWRKEV